MSGKWKLFSIIFVIAGCIVLYFIYRTSIRSILIGLLVILALIGIIIYINKKKKTGN